MSDIKTEIVSFDDMITMHCPVCDKEMLWSMAMEEPVSKKSKILYVSKCCTVEYSAYSHTVVIASAVKGEMPGTVCRCGHEEKKHNKDRGCQERVDKRQNFEGYEYHSNEACPCWKYRVRLLDNDSLTKEVMNMTGLRVANQTHYKDWEAKLQRVWRKKDRTGYITIVEDLSEGSEYEVRREGKPYAFDRVYDSMDEAVSMAEASMLEAESMHIDNEKVVGKTLTEEEMRSVGILSKKSLEDDVADICVACKACPECGGIVGLGGQVFVHGKWVYCTNCRRPVP